MYCRICGKEIPNDSLFCLYCGQEVSAASSSGAQPDLQAEKKSFETKLFTFSPPISYAQAAAEINEWLNEKHLQILDARFTLDAELLAGTIVPQVAQLELDWQQSPNAAPYCIGMMLGGRNDFGLGKKKNNQQLNKQYERWRRDHAELEIAALQEQELSLGWTSTALTLFFYRPKSTPQA